MKQVQLFAKIMDKPLCKNANFCGCFKPIFSNSRKASFLYKTSKIFLFFTRYFYDLLHEDTGGYKRVQGVTQGYKRVTRGYRELKGLTGGYKGLQGLTRGYKGLKGVRGLQRVTGSYKGLQGVARGDRGLQGVTGGFKGL